MSEGFDLRTEIRNAKTGQVEMTQHYIMKIGAEGTTFERPPGSGMLYDTTGKLIKDGLKESREKAEAEAKIKAELEAAAKKVEEDKRIAALDKEKQEIIAQAKAEAQAEAEVMIKRARAEIEAMKKVAVGK